MIFYDQYDDIFYIFISMSSCLEGEERDMEQRDPGSNFGGGRWFSDQLKREIEGRADCMVREKMEEEQLLFCH